MKQNETICAAATASGPAAIHVIRVSGENAFELVNPFFKAKDLTEVPSHTVHFGTFRNGDQIIDEVLITIFKGAKSYTGENSLEISCHGSPFIKQQILNVLTTNGCRMAEPGEFTMRAFLNGKMDLSQAEAVADLIASDSQASHDLAMKQMRGGFSNEIKELRGQLIHFASMLELELDFGEEDVEFADRTELENLLTKIIKVVTDLAQSFQLGNVLKNGVPVVIAGKPNAGKSTLLNQFLKEDKAIVSNIAGTTRDVIEDEMVLNGVSFRFIDTAGIRDTSDEIEAIGVERTFEKMKGAAIVLYLFDASTLSIQDFDSELKEIQEQVQQTDARLLLIANKIDDTNLEAWQNHIPKELNVAYISAKEGLGIAELEEQLVNLVYSGAVNAEDVIVTNARHYDALVRSNESLNQALNSLQTGVTSDFVAMDIRQSLHFLGLITGEIGTEDLLDSIFFNFCIGK